MNLRSKDYFAVVWKKGRIQRKDSKREGYSFANSINWNQQKHSQINASLASSKLSGKSSNLSVWFVINDVTQILRLFDTLQC